MQIDGVLAEYGVEQVLWNWKKEAIEHNESAEVYVAFKIVEVIDRQQIKVGVRVDCPIIWDKEKPKGRPPRPEQVNWSVSLRAMYHFIYTHLNSAYALQSSKAIAFLGYIQSGNKQLKDLILPELKRYQALEDSSSSRTNENIQDAEIISEDRPQ